MLPLLLALAAASQVGPPTSLEDRYDACVGLATSDPAAAEADAGHWQFAGGGFLAMQCRAIALSNEQRWPGAAAEFESAAHAAEIAKDVRAANYWAQAGNAWLASGDATKARAALDAALSGGTLTGLQRGEAHLDRARALVAAGATEDARDDIDLALADASGDPLAWLLSATLARRTGDLKRAQKDIAEALQRSGDDASVQLEAGNIAASAGDEAGARAAWSLAVNLAPDGPVKQSASAALAQFTGAAKP